MAEAGEDDGGHGPHGYRPRRRIEQRQFTEIAARREFADLAAVARDCGTALEDDKKRFAVFALANEIGAVGSFNDLDVTSYHSQVASRAPHEQWDPTKALDGGGP